VSQYDKKQKYSESEEITEPCGCTGQSWSLFLYLSINYKPSRVRESSPSHSWTQTIAVRPPVYSVICLFTPSFCWYSQYYPWKDGQAELTWARCKRYIKQSQQLLTGHSWRRTLETAVLLPVRPARGAQTTLEMLWTPQKPLTSTHGCNIYTGIIRIIRNHLGQGVFKLLTTTVQYITCKLTRWHIMRLLQFINYSISYVYTTQHTPSTLPSTEWENCYTSDLLLI